MPTFVLMTKFPPEISQKMKDRAEVGREWIVKVREKCPPVKFICHYALLGPYDFLDIYEAESADEAAKVSMISLAFGAERAESWNAIPYQRFLELVKEL